MMEEPLVKIVPTANSSCAILLNRPLKKNALNISLLTSFLQAMESVGSDPDVRTIFLMTSGNDFCTGMDLTEAADESLIDKSSHLIEKAFLALLTCGKVTISCIQGKAYAGGAGLALACDFMLMEEGSSLAFPEVKRGLSPALVSAILAAKLPGSIISKLLLFSHELTADESLKLQLAYALVKKGDLLQAAIHLASTTLSASPEAISETKQLLLKNYRIKECFSEAAKVHRQARRSKDAAEGIQAFVEKRKPSWASN
ncbi:enoyl-CoA hydratase/isomerase family protein [Estrella lausannensis]|uniref:Enoyl-CoA hydratase/isomerase n=1 Tax=Estrella lausannensis TaxID=483423 RepID=A0A0H5E709_9BACT|nr:enoyl-CoA hydratase/isomerase family protein [Estrella lausannensis]CRX39080.1 Enoyl-CoA hydratase/isomerase [Estrella lausannensis]